MATTANHLSLKGAGPADGGWADAPDYGAAIVEVDTAWRVVAANAAYGAMTGQTRGTLIGVEAVALCGHTALRAAVAAGRPWQGTLRVQPPHAAGRWHAVTATPLFDPDGGVRGCTVVAFDATQHQRTAIAAAARAARFEAVIENSPSLIFIRSREGGYITANRRARALFGRDSFDGLTLHDVVPPEVADGLLARERQVLETGQPLTEEETLPTADGGTVPFLAYKFLVPDPKSGDDALCVMLTDIAAQHRREQENARHRARFEAVFGNAPVQMFLKNDAGAFVAMNRPFREVFGIGNAMVPSGHAFLDADQVARLEAIDAAVFGTGEPYRCEETVTLLSGEQRHMLSTRFLVPDPVSGEDLLCRVGIDITEQIALQQSLERSRQAAMAATEAKSRFLATMSHEIRTPMNGVLAMAELLADRITAAEEARMVGIIRDSGQALLTILNDILDFSKMEAGRIALETVPFALGDVARRVEAVHALKAREKALAFTVSVDPEAAAPRLCDPHRLQQILHNLVSNAIKFTERGGVAVTITGDAGAVEIVVRDDGCGMTQAQAALVFDEFAQADSSTTRRFGGTGLGMSIVKELVDAMGGHIGLETAAGVGTTVRVTLPLPPADTPSRDPDGAQATALPSGLRVLAADDNEVNRVVLGSFLKSLGVAVTLAEGGREAIAASRSVPYDVLMLDISMPDMDGIETLAAIRLAEVERGTRPAPAIAVTANAMPHQIDSYRAAGFDGHLAKPIRRETLLARLAESVTVSNGA